MPERKEWLKLRGSTREDTVENLAFVTLFVAAIFTVVGITVGTFVPGFPVALAITGAFLVLVGIVLYVTSEFMRILAPSETNEVKRLSTVSSPEKEEKKE